MTQDVEHHVNLIQNPSASDWLEGWAVLLCTRFNWDIKAFHPNRELAEKEVREAGADYGCVRGFRRPGTTRACIAAAQIAPRSLSIFSSRWQCVRELGSWISCRLRSVVLFTTIS